MIQNKSYTFRNFILQQSVVISGVHILSPNFYFQILFFVRGGGGGILPFLSYFSLFIQVLGKLYVFIPEIPIRVLQSN